MARQCVFYIPMRGHKTNQRCPNRATRKRYDEDDLDRVFHCCKRCAEKADKACRNHG